MNEKFIVRKATENDIPRLHNMIKGLASYEKRPQDMFIDAKYRHCGLGTDFFSKIEDYFSYICK